MTVSGWADLPPELLWSITQRLALADVIRFRTVCFCWALALGKTCGRRLRPPPPPIVPIFRHSPWLLLPTSDDDINACTVLSLFEGRRYTIFSQPEINDPLFIGTTSEGWIVTLDSLLNPRLFNPLTDHELFLPSFSTLYRDLEPIAWSDQGLFNVGFYAGYWANFPSETLTKILCNVYVRKIVFTSSPSQGGLAVAVCSLDIDVNFLSFAKVGDKAWSLAFEFKPKFEFLDYLEDVAYDKDDGKLYVLTNLGAVFILQRMNQSWKVVSTVARWVEPAEVSCWRRSLMFSGSDLLLVTRIRKEGVNGEEEETFNVFRLNLRRRRIDDGRLQHIDDSCWVPVNDLGDRTLFVDCNNGFSLASAEELGIKRNRVYFTEDFLFIPSKEVGSFDLESNMVDYLYNLDFLCHAPIWFIPNISLWE